MYLLRYLPLFFVLVSCKDLSKYDLDFDTKSKISRTEIEKKMSRSAKKESENRNQDKSQPPQLSQIIMSASPPKIGGGKTISFSVTDQVPLKDALIELGRVSEIDVDIDSRIEGGINLNATNRPLREVVERIAKLGNLRYSFDKNVLHFEVDGPYSKNYFVDYLSGASLWNDVESNITSILNNQSSSRSGQSGASSNFSSNKSAGIITVFANNKEHEEISEYLNDVMINSSAQVLIEAKVVEVNLTDKYSTGINWSWLGSNKSNTKKMSGSYGYESTAPLTMVLNGVFGNDIDVSISALEEFGTTKTLSSPRIHAINNQEASLTFSNKLIYFEVESDTVVANGDAVEASKSVNSTIVEKDIGLELMITPSINLSTRDVTLKIEPKISDKFGDPVTDPANENNKIPIIQSRELSTIAKIKSGNVIVIGGLMEDKTTNKDNGIPFINRIPVIGWFFKSVSKEVDITETVIFVKATIIDSSTRPGKIDREIQEIFDTNRRQFFE